MRATAFLPPGMGAGSEDAGASLAADQQRGPGPRWRDGQSWPLITAVLFAVGGLCALAEGPLWNHATALAGVNLAVSLLFVFTGLRLRGEPGQRGVAYALMLAGVLRSFDFIDAWNESPLGVYTLVFGGVDRLFGAWALLRYPNHSLLRHQRIYLVLLTGWMLVGRVLIAVTSTAPLDGYPASSWWPTLISNTRLADILNYVVNAGEGILGVALLVLLVLRLTQTRGLDRIVITPIIVAGLAAVIAAGASAVAQMVVSLAASPNPAYLAESAVDLAVPLAFLVAVIQRALLLRNIAGLTAQISGGADVGAVRHALRSTLHDPTLDVLDLSALDEVQATPDGSAPAASAPAASASASEPDRLVEFIHADGGAPIAVVIADPALARYRGLFDAAVQTSALALKNAQLQAQAAREKLEQVRASQARIIEAGLAERRRLERDLHDGVQQHLLGLAAQLAAAMTGTADPVAAAAFAQAKDELREVLGELRDLAHGIHPALLSQGGLAAALEDVAERLPLPVRVAVSGPRAAPAVEATAYYIACEALANAVKHANATRAVVTVRVADSQLAMEIADDGVGGAAPDGHGLGNIADRVSALDGEVSIDSPPGQGTRVEVRIPCG
jgi:signal transduction histidine kinase